MTSHRSPGGLGLHLDVGPDRRVRLSVSAATADHAYVPPTASGPAPAEVWLSGDGRTRAAASPRLFGGALGARLRYRGHEESDTGLAVTTHDELTGVTVTTRCSTYAETPTLRAKTVVRNDGPGPVTLQQVTSLVLGLGGGDPGWRDDLTVSLAYNTWFREAQWRSFSMTDLGLDDPGVAPWRVPCSRARYSLSNPGSWSSGGHLPMGAVHDRRTGTTWLWQIEHNGPWSWEIGDQDEHLYLLLGGPNGQDHQWATVLEPGAEFTSVPVALTRVDGPIEDAFAALTSYRRAIRRPHPDHVGLPVVFNDYMNCLMAEATEEKLRPLVDVAARVGAEYFCIDAGWYADDGSWWDAVGAWEPSQTRFPSGLDRVLEEIRERGMVPGLWLEPEVVGVRSPVAELLPAEAFFQRDGRRVVEAERYQLDFRHPAVVARMDAVVGRLVEGLGVGYLKLDYNIDVTQGTDVGATPGAGMLGHARAYLAWIDALLDRYPTLVLETCSSGGQRLDYALLARHPIQSVSDQQDPLRHAAISAAAPTAVTPEQAASWAYPQPEWSDDLIAFTMVNALLGRVHLSGRVDLLSEPQLQLVADALAAYRELRPDLTTATPYWPLGLPGWTDDWLALGMLTTDDRGHLTVWRRAGTEICRLPLPRWAGRRLEVECRYPWGADGSWTWDADRAVLTVRLTGAPQARLLLVRPVTD